MNMEPPTVPGLSDDRRRILREGFMREITKVDEPTTVLRRRLWRAVIPAAGLAAAVAIGTAVTGPAAPTGQPPVGAGTPTGAGSTSGAGSDDPVVVMERLALIAESRPDPGVRDDQFVFVHERSQLTGFDGGERPNKQPVREVQTWSSVDGTHGNRTTHLNPTSSSDWDETNPPSLDYPTYRFLEGLPTDPEELLAVIYAQHPDGFRGWSREKAAFIQFMHLLHRNIAPPKMIGALYRAVARIPGVTTVARVTDGIGRPGVALTLQDPADEERTELIFDQDGARYLGWRIVDRGRVHQVPAGTVTSWIVVLDWAVVDRIGQTG